MGQFVEQNLIISALIQLTLGMVCALRRRHRGLSSLYSYYSFGLFGIGFTALLGRFGPQHYVDAALATSLVLTMLFFYHFVAMFVGEISRARRFVLGIQYGTTALLGLLAMEEFIGGGLLGAAVVLLGLPPALFSLESLFIRSGSSFSRLEKRQLSYLLVSHALFVGAGGVEILLSSLGGGEFSGLWTLGLLGLALGTAVSIVRYKFMDLPDLLGWGVAILVVGHVLLALYSESVFFIESRFGPLLGGGAMSTFKIIMATGVFLLLLDPLKKLVIAQMDRVLMRESYAFQRELTSLSSSLVSVLDLHELFHRTLKALSTSPRVARAEILLTRGEGEDFRALSFGPVGQEPVQRLDGNSPLVQLLSEKGNRVLVLDEMERSVQLFYPSEHQKLVAAAAETLRQLGGELVVPMWFQNKLNGLLVFNSAIESGPFTTREGEILLSLAGQLAITAENARIYEEMRQRDRLVAVGEMATGLAHEIRNPLGAIKAAAQYIEPGMVDGEDREFLGILVEEVDRLNNVVTRFLDYARPLRTRLSTFDLNQLIDKAVTLMAPEAGLQNVELETKLTPELPEVFIDGEQIRQVLLNLLLNAIDAIEDGGKVSVTTTQLPPDEREHLGYVAIQVKDSGLGIPQEQIDKIFNPFYTTKGNGTGLGLAITYRIVQAHEGNLSVQSEVGVGTTFEFKLPIRTDPEAVPISTLTEPPPESLLTPQFEGLSAAPSLEVVAAGAAHEEPEP